MLKIKRFNQKVTKDVILNWSVILLAVTGILQDSMVFNQCGILIDILKWILLIQNALVFLLQFAEIFTFNNVIKTVTLSLLVMYTCVRTSNYSFLLVCMFLVIAKSITIQEFIKYSLNILKAGIVLHVILWVLNLVLNFGYPVYMGDNYYRISFLFTHPNIAAIKFGWGIIMYIWLMWEKLALKDLVKSFVLIILVYIATKSDSCLIVLFFLIFTGLRKYRNIKKYIIFASKWCFPILGILNIYIASVFMKGTFLSGVLQKINLVFNQRIAMAYLAIHDNGMTLIGQYISMLHNWDDVFHFGNYTIDSLFIYLYVCIGFIYFVLFSIGFYMLAKYKDYKAALVVITFSLYALIENHCLYLTNCFAILLLKCVIFKEKKIK